MRCPNIFIRWPRATFGKEDRGGEPSQFLTRTPFGPVSGSPQRKVSFSRSALGNRPRSLTLVQIMLLGWRRMGMKTLIFHLKIKSTPPQTDRWADLFEAKLRIWFNNECLGRWEDHPGRVWPLNIASAAVAGKSGKTAASTAASPAASVHLFAYFVHCRYMDECRLNKALYTLQLNKTWDMRDGWTKIHLGKYFTDRRTYFFSAC